MGNISNAISNKPHLKAIDDVFKQRFESLDLSPVMMYIVDTAPEEALYYLAEQLNVLAFKGWILATTIEDKRALIKKAIELNKFKGTIWAIKEAVKAVGFEGAEVVEHVGIDYDGTYLYNGAINYIGGSWANFRVKIAIDENVEINALSVQNIINFIIEYKNDRSFLVDLTFQINFNDVLSYNEFLELGEGVEDNLTQGIYYNGAATYNGAQLYNKGAGLISLQIIDTSTGIIINDEF